MTKSYAEQWNRKFFWWTKNEVWVSQKNLRFHSSALHKDRNSQVLKWVWNWNFIIKSYIYLYIKCKFEAMFVNRKRTLFSKLMSTHLSYIWLRWHDFSSSIDPRNPCGVPLGPGWPQDERLGCTFLDFQILDPENLEKP